MNQYDEIAKDRVILVTTFADALVYIVDDGKSEDNQLIIDKALEGSLYDYIIQKYENYPIVQNTIIGENFERYINPVYQIGFERANLRPKYHHAENNGLLNIIGVTFDIVANWNDDINEAIEKLNQ